MTPSALEMTNQPTQAINFRKPTWWKRPTNFEWNLITIVGVMLLASTSMTPTLATPHFSHSRRAESLPSLSAEDNGLIEKQRGRGLFQDGEYTKVHKLCLTPGCVKAAASVINNMDPSVDPCDDFYQFACGKYIRDTIIEREIDYPSMVDIPTKIVNNNLRLILTEPIQPDEQQLTKMVKSLFKSCMDTEKIEKEGLGPFKETLKNLGGWPVLEGEKWNDTKFTWKDSVYKFKETGHELNYFIDLTPTEHIKNNTIMCISLSPAQLYVKAGSDNKTMERYYKYMVDVAVLLGADRQRATEELRDSLDFEMRLAEISVDPEVSGDLEKNEPWTFADVLQKFPSIPWQEYLDTLLNPLTVRQDDFIIVTSPKYLSGLEALLNTTSKRIQANYVIWRVVMDSASYLTEELNERKSKLISNKLQNGSRLKKCMDIITAKLKFVIGSLYVRRMFNENDKTYVVEIVNNIQEEMYKLLSSNDWMDDETRKNAIDKVKEMFVTVAYPDEFLDEKILNAFYENLKLDDKDNFYTSILKINQFNNDYLFSKLRQPVNRTDWETTISTLVTNAYYDPQKNKIIILAGILLGVYFSNDRPRYMNYGSIGTILGHEITHGFDNHGSTYDKHGNYVDWWEEKTKKRFMEKVECIISQYGNYTDPEVGLKLNGTRTQGENISDNGGYREAYYAYNSWAKQHGVEPRLPGLEDYTPQQMFWLSAANVWCAKYSPTVIKLLINTEAHSIPRFRVIGPLSNLEDFSNDFQCPLGSNMNPVKKCQVW